MALNPHRMPSTRQLRYFVALCEQRHFGKAAAQCFVSQSAFSTAIQELEALLSVQLVDRTNRRVAITALGQEIAVLARLCLQDIETLVESAAAHGKPLHGSLRLGVIPTIAPFLLPGLLPQLRAEWPELKLFLQEDMTAELHRQLLDGTIDAALLALPADLPGTEHRILLRDPFVLIARRQSALVQLDRYRFNRLPAGSVLLMREGHCLRDHATEACRIRDSQKVSSFAASSLLTLVEMVDADLGVSFLPEMAVAAGILRDTDIEVHALDSTNFREIGLVWRRGSARGAEFQLLGDFIAANAGHDAS